MKLRFSYPTIGQLHIRDALWFPPPALAVGLAQTRKFANRAADSEGFDVDDFAKYLEEHYRWILAGNLHRSRKLFVTTVTLDAAMAAEASMGDSRPSAATGMPTVL